MTTRTPEQPAGDNQPNTAGTRPGELLRQTREARGLSIEAAARQLNFLPAYIPALENEDFGPLHSTTFVKGYLRTYARFLGLDANKVLQAFIDQYPELDKKEPIKPVESIEPDKGGLQRIYRFLSILLLLGLLVLVVFWWQNREADILTVSSSLVQVDTLNGETIVAPLTAPASEQPLPATATPVESDPEPELSLSAETAEPAPAPVATTSQDMPVVQATTAADEPAPMQVPAIHPPLLEPPAQATANQPDRLALLFSSDCWVEIVDANAQRLVSDLMQAGDEILLQGQPPFQVVFGYGPAAQVYYLGEAVDFSARIRRNGYTSFTVE